jgi:hypothetical protein
MDVMLRMRGAIIAIVIYRLVMVVNYHIPHKATKDNSVIIEYLCLDFFIQDILDTVWNEINPHHIHIGND